MVILAIQFKRIYTRDVWYWLARELRLREYERLELLQSLRLLVVRERQKVAELHRMSQHQAVALFRRRTVSF